MWKLRQCSLVAHRVKRLPARRGTRVRSLDREDHQEKERAIHSGTLAWKIPWTEEPGSHHLWGRKESDTTEQLHSLTPLGSDVSRERPGDRA